MASFVLPFREVRFFLGGFRANGCVLLSEVGGVDARELGVFIRYGAAGEVNAGEECDLSRSESESWRTVDGRLARLRNRSNDGGGFSGEEGELMLGNELPMASETSPTS